MRKRIREILEWYLTKKISTEIKSCLMLFLMLCFCGVYEWVCGNRAIGIIPMLVMVVVAYILIWVQVMLHADFDEVDRLGIKEWLVILGSSAIYAVVARLGNWFDGKTLVEIGFFVYMIVAYLCTYLIYYMKRVIDAKMLNGDLKRFQQRTKEND